MLVVLINVSIPSHSRRCDGDGVRLSPAPWMVLVENMKGDRAGREGNNIGLRGKLSACYMSSLSSPFSSTCYIDGIPVCSSMLSLLFVALDADLYYFML